MSWTTRQPEPSTKAPGTITMFFTPAGASAATAVPVNAIMAMARLNNLRMVFCLQ
jgi:hypothetical protein